jgi:hypothetical protein
MSEQPDIVERLRWPLNHRDTLAIANAERSLAANEIERLRGELENVQRDRMAQVEAERLRNELARLYDIPPHMLGD